jgi:hypothetical protein
MTGHMPVGSYPDIAVNSAFLYPVPPWQRAHPRKEALMTISALTAAIAVVALPVAVLAHQAVPESASKRDYERRYCVVYSQIGTRLVNARRCHTRAERDALRFEGRLATEHLQILKTQGR